MKTVPALLMTFVLLTGAPSRAQTVSEASTERERNAAVWIAPIATTSALVLGTRNRGANYWLNLNLGGQFAAASQQWGVDTIYNAMVDDVSQERFDRFEVAGGPIFHPLASVRGIFIQLKLAAAINNLHGYAYRAGRRLITNDSWFEIDGGVSFGWEKSWGPFYLAFNLGLRMGYYSNAPEELMFFSGIPIPLNSGVSHLLLNVEANFLRLGVAF